MSAPDTDFSAGCANGHANLKDAKFCSTCGITIWQPQPDPEPPAPPLPDPNAPPGTTTTGEPLHYQYTGQYAHDGRTEPGYGQGPDERDRPSALMVWLWLFVFSPVVLFLAPSYANKAKRFGFKETGRYWVPFWLTIAGYVAVVALIATAASAVHNLPSYHSSSSYSAPTYSAPTTHSYSSSIPSFTVTQQSGPAMVLRNLIVNSGTGTWDDNRYATVTNASCEANIEPDVPYLWNCNITRSDTGNHAYWVDWDGAASSGWRAVGRTR